MQLQAGPHSFLPHSPPLAALPSSCAFAECQCRLSKTALTLCRDTRGLFAVPSLSRSLQFLLPNTPVCSSSRPLECSRCVARHASSLVHPRQGKAVLHPICKWGLSTPPLLSLPGDSPAAPPIRGGKAALLGRHVPAGQGRMNCRSPGSVPSSSASSISLTGLGAELSQCEWEVAAQRDWQPGWICPPSCLLAAFMPRLRLASCSHRQEEGGERDAEGTVPRNVC